MEEKLTRQDAIKGLRQEIQNIKRCQEMAGEEFGTEEIEHFRRPLSIEEEQVKKILLSWGGGEDGYKLTFKDDELLRGVYYMANWGEYAEIELNEEELNLIQSVYLY